MSRRKSFRRAAELDPHLAAPGGKSAGRQAAKSSVAARAECDQVRGDRDAVGDFYVQDASKGFRSAGLETLQVLQQAFDVVFAADVFHCSLRAESGRARQNQDGAGRDREPGSRLTMA